jgi:hypothetical protein
MAQLFLIGIGAGAASALLFASIASGSLISVLLFYLAPLPILIAALGWSHWAALVAAVTAAVGLAAMFDGYFFVAFLLGIGLPAWWLGYLALLARPAATPDGLEWYPIGRLVFWAAVVSALIVIAAILNYGTDQETFRAMLRRGLERMLRVQGRPPVGDSERLIDFLVVVLPPAAAIFTTLTQLLNLWLAARVVRISNRLRRPPPDLSAMEFPSYAAPVTGAAVVGMFVPGMIGTIAGVLAASLLTAYGILGFAVLHAITRGMGSRMLLLGGAYVAVIVFFWPGLLMTLLGLADSAFDIRRRVAGRRGPPQAPIS